MCLGTPTGEAYYHWAVVADALGNLGVREFWAPRILGTRDYRASEFNRERAEVDAQWRQMKERTRIRREDFR